MEDSPAGRNIGASTEPQETAHARYRPNPAAPGATPDEPLAAILIGAGFAGIGMAVVLRRAGIEDFLILERGRDVGGVWRDNSYPGAACGVPSHLYSFSFEPNPDWSRTFAPQAGRSTATCSTAPASTAWRRTCVSAPRWRRHATTKRGRCGR